MGTCDDKETRTTDVLILKSASTIIFDIILLLTLTVLTASCNKPERATEQKEKISIGVGSMALSFPVIIAREKGFFSYAGLDVTIKYYPSGKKALEGMFAGEADMATTTETPIVLNSFTRGDFAVFATFAHSYNDNKVLARRDRGISKPSDLKGRKIGIAAKTSSHFFAYVYFAEHQIDPACVQLVNFDAPDLATVLKDGKVDAVIVFEPYAYHASKVLSDKIVNLPQSDLYKATYNLTTMRSYVKEHPESLKKVIKAVDRTIAFIKKNHQIGFNP